MVWLALAGASGVIAGTAVSTRAIATPRVSFSPEWQQTPHDFGFAVAMRGEHPYAVGNFGIIRGTLGGAGATPAKSSVSWARVADSGDESLLGIAFSPDGRGVAAGQVGLMLEAAADSDNWHRLESPDRRRLFAVAASESGAFLVAGELGVLLYQHPDGARFQEVKTKWSGFEAPNFYDAAFISPDTAVVVGESGHLLTVTNGAISAVLEAGQESLYAVRRCGDGIYAVGQEGRVEVKLRQREWLASTVPGGPDLYALACIHDAALAAVGAGSLYLANGLGDKLSWQNVTPRSVQVGWFSGVAALSPSSSLLLTGPGGLWEARLSDVE